MGEPYTTLNVSGPYREPREPVFSYDYSVQRPTWPTPHSVRVKVGIHEELDFFKTKVLNVSGGSPGQQLKVSQLLSRKIADRKLEIANLEGLFSGRLDVMVGIFAGPLAHLFPQLEVWMKESSSSVRNEIKTMVGL
jgi:hypothetical protein